MKRKQTEIRLRMLAATQVAVGLLFAGQVAMRLTAQAAPQPTSLAIELTKAEPVGLNGTQSDGINRFRYTFKVSNTGFVPAQNTRIRFKIPFMHDGPLPNTPVASSSSSSSSSSSCTPGFGNICVPPSSSPWIPPSSGGSSSSGPAQVPVPNISFEFGEIVNANDNSSHALLNCVNVGSYIECPIGTDLYLGPNNGPGSIAPNKFLHVAMTFRDTSVSPNPRCTSDDSYQFITTTSVTMDNQNLNPTGSVLTTEKDLACTARAQALPNLSVRLERDPTISCDPGDAEYPTGFTSYDDVVTTKYGFASYLRKPDEQLPGGLAWTEYGTNKMKKITCPELIMLRRSWYNSNNPTNAGESYTKVGRAKPINTIVTVKNNGTAAATNVRVRLFFAVTTFTALPPVGTVVGNELPQGQWPDNPEYLQSALQFESFRMTRSGPLTCVVTGNSSLPAVPDITTAAPTSIVMGTYPYYQPSMGPPSNFNKYVTVECKGDAPLSLYPNAQLTFNMKFASQVTSSNTTNGVTYASTAGYLFATCLGDVKSDTPEQDVMDNTQVKCPTPFFDPATYSPPPSSSSSSSSSVSSSAASTPQGIPAVITQPNPGGSYNAPKGHIDFDAANRRISIWTCSPTVTMWRFTNVAAWNTDITWFPVNQYSEQAVNNQCGNTTNHRTRLVTFDELANIACQGMPPGYDLDVRAYVSASVAVPIPGSPIHIKCAVPPPPQPTPSSSSSVTPPPPGPPPTPGPTQAVAGLIPGSLDTSMPEIAGWACYRPSYNGNQIYTSPGYDLNKALTIKIYVDGPLGVGTLSETVAADKQREPAVGNSCYNLSPYHGFSVAPPAEYCDGQIHTMHVYAFDGNLYSPLSSSPKSFVCGPPAQAQNGLVLGDVASADAFGISGWTCANPSLNNNTDEKLRVRFYKDGPIGVGTLVQTQNLVVADKPSGAAVGNACGTYQHTFSAVTAQMQGVCDGTPHQIYAYGFRGAQYNLLSNSPATVTCAGPSSSSSSDASGGSCTLINPNGQAPAGSILRGVTISGNRTISGYACWWVNQSFPAGQSPNFGVPFQIRFYMNGPIGVGTLIKTVSADSILPPSLATTCGGNAAHGFVAVLPQNACATNQQMAQNQIFVYAVAPNGQYMQIADQSQIGPGPLCWQSYSSMPAVQASPSCTTPAPATSSSSSYFSSSASTSSATASSAQGSSVSPNMPADLAATTITLDGSPNTPPLYMNQIVRYKMTVKNVGGMPAQNAGFYVAFPGWTILEPYTYGADAPCVASQLPNNQGPGLICGTVSSLAGGAEYTRYVSFRVKNTADCGFQGLIAAFTSTVTPDANTGNNVKTIPISTAVNCASTFQSSSSSFSSSVSSASSAIASSAQSSSVNPNAPADLAATVLEPSDSPSTPPLYPNQVVRYKMTIRNVGGLPAQNAGFYVGFPGLTIAEAYNYGSDAPCVAAQIPNAGPGLFCGTVPSLAGGAEYTRYVSFRVKPTADCGFQGLVHISTTMGGTDANANNNIKTAPFTIAANCTSTQFSSSSSSQGPVIVSDAHNPFGTHEAANASTFGGVACDLDNTNGTVPVLLYDVTNPQAPLYLGLAQADQPGGQTVANACGGNGNHRWSFTVPSSVCTGQPHTVKAFLLNLVGTQGANALANGSPRTITCN